MKRSDPEVVHKCTCLVVTLQGLQTQMFVRGMLEILSVLLAAPVRR